MDAAEKKDSDYQTLRSKVRYVGENSLGRCLEKWPTLKAEKAVGKPVRDLLPLATVESISVGGDELDMPQVLLVRALMEGSISSGQAVFIGPPIEVQMKFNDGRCLDMSFYHSFSGQLGNRATIAEAKFAVPPIEGVGKKFTEAIAGCKRGVTTRADFEKHFVLDGGISVPFRVERYVLKDGKIGDKVLKTNVAFRPAASDKKESHPRQSPKDLFVRCSPVFLEPAYFD